MTPDPGPRWSDKQVEQMVGNLLQMGVLFAALVTAAGGVVFLLHHGRSPAVIDSATPEPAALRQLGMILTGALHFDSLSVIQLGVVLLIATPVARVFLSLVAFVIQKDRLYTVITSIVLILLTYSLFFSGQA